MRKLTQVPSYGRPLLWTAGTAPAGEGGRRPRKGALRRRHKGRFLLSCTCIGQPLLRAAGTASAGVGGGRPEEGALSGWPKEGFLLPCASLFALPCFLFLRSASDLVRLHCFFCTGEREMRIVPRQRLRGRLRRTRMPGIRRVQRPLHPTDGFWRGLRQSWRTRRGRCEWPLQGKWRLFRVSAPLLVAVGQLLLRCCCNSCS